jgi:hypothetical protein
MTTIMNNNDEHIFYSILDINNVNNVNNETKNEYISNDIQLLSSRQLFNQLCDNYDYDLCSQDELIMAMEMDYSKYKLKQLHTIMNYYNISKIGLKKKCDIIRLIIAFEMDEANKQIVIKRHRMWNYVSILRQDNFFSKYILFEI